METISSPESDVERMPNEVYGVSTEDILRGMLAASNDACWCMEFNPPVDVTADDHQVVHEIFTNGPVWRHCNAAMERLYRLPAGQDMNARPVEEIFPDNPSNRKFLLNLIANGFEVDGSPALDRRYDGLEIYVENDVRAHITNGKLYRMFGTVRNVAKHRRREQALNDQLAALEGAVAALPSPFFTVDASDVIETLNPAAVAWFGPGCEGQSFGALICSTCPGPVLPELTKAIAKVRALGVSITLRFAMAMPDTVWQIAPREAANGTGFVVLLSPNDVMEV
jgi:PAS domain-containing protein